MGDYRLRQQIQKYIREQSNNKAMLLLSLVGSCRVRGTKEIINPSMFVQIVYLYMLSNYAEMP